MLIYVNGSPHIFIYLLANNKTCYLFGEYCHIVRN